MAIDRGYDKPLRNVVGRARLIEAAAGLGDGVGFEYCTSRADIKENRRVYSKSWDPCNGGVAKAGWHFGARVIVRACNGSRSGGVGRSIIVILRYVSCFGGSRCSESINQGRNVRPRIIILCICKIEGGVKE